MPRITLPPPTGFFGAMDPQKSKLPSLPSHRIPKLLFPILAGALVLLPAARAEDWKVVWKDDMQTLKVDRDSIRVNGSQVEYWYSDTLDAIVDSSEFRYHALSDCASNQMRLTEVYDPSSGQTNPVKDSGWKEKPYDSHDSVTVMHYEVCRDYSG